ncbi:MAG: AI-2E family transporter [Caulobacteraceae bacterium]
MTITPARPAPDPIARHALVFIAVILAGAALWWLRGILTPLILAIFLLVIIDGFGRWLEHRVPGFPKAAAMPTALIVSMLGFVLTVYWLAESATGFVSQLVSYTPKLHGLLFRLAAQFGFELPPTASELIRQINPQKYVADAASSVQAILSDAFFVLIYLGFLIASRHGLRRKIVVLFPTRDDREDAVEVFTRIRVGIERYVWVQTVTGLMIGGAAWAVMAAIGLDNAFFWAFLIFLASYIPMIGGAIGVSAPPLMALVQFDTLWQAIVLFGALQAIFFVVGNIITPKMQGTSLNMDPVVVLLSLAFWGAIWGIPGAFLSSPLTVIAMVVLVQFPGTRWIAVLLSADGQPENEASPAAASFERREVAEEMAEVEKTARQTPSRPKNRA